MAKNYVSVATCEKTLRQFIHDHYGHTPKPGNKPPEEAMEKYESLSLLVELAQHGVKYVKENKILLRARAYEHEGKLEEE